MKREVPSAPVEKRFEPVDPAKLTGSRFPVVADIARNASQILRDPALRWGPNQSWSNRRT